MTKILHGVYNIFVNASIPPRKFTYFNRSTEKHYAVLKSSITNNKTGIDQFQDCSKTELIKEKLSEKKEKNYQKWFAQIGAHIYSNLA